MADTVIEAEIKSNVGEVADQTERLADATGDAKKGFSGIGKSVKGLGTALKAAGIGLFIALFAKLMEVFGKNQKVLDTFNTAMTALSIAFNDLFGFIENNIGTVLGYFKALFEDPSVKIKELGTAIKDGLVVRFNEFLEVLGLVGKAFSQLIDGEFSKSFDTIKEAGVQVVDVYTGVDDSFEKVTETIKGYVTETIKQADAITQTAKAAGRAEVEFARLNAKYLKDAEIQRQIRDDETKTFAERIAANEELSKVLDKQSKDQEKQVQVKIDNAQAQYNINKSEENFLELERAKNEMLELEETITGQLSEQKTNAVALEKELLETQKEVRAEGLSGLEKELQELQDAYDLKLEMARKSGEGTTAITKQFEKQKTDLIRANLATQLDAYANLAGALKTLAGENKQLAIAEAIIATWSAATKALDAPAPLNFINMASVLAAGFANVQKIMQTDVGTGGGGSTPSMASTPAPEMLSGQFTLGGVQEQQPVQAYVVTDDMTNNQNKLANIRRRATI